MALTVSHPVADRPYCAVISDSSVRAPPHLYPLPLRVRHFFFPSRRESSPPVRPPSYRRGGSGGGFKKRAGTLFLLVPSATSTDGLTGPLPSSPFLLPSRRRFRQRSLCRISECAKMKREKRSPGDARDREIEMGEMGRGEEELYISRVSPSPVRSFVRSFVWSVGRSVGRSFRFGYAFGADISGEPRSHFQFNLLKARQKVIRYFTSAVDRDEIARASSRADSGLNGMRQ